MRLIPKILLICAFISAAVVPSLAQEPVPVRIQNIYMVPAEDGSCRYGFAVSIPGWLEIIYQEMDFMLLAAADEAVNAEIRHINIESLGGAWGNEFRIAETSFICGIPRFTVIGASARVADKRVDLLKEKLVSVGENRPAAIVLPSL